MTLFCEHSIDQAKRSHNETWKSTSVIFDRLQTLFKFRRIYNLTIRFLLLCCVLAAGGCKSEVFDKTAVIGVNIYKQPFTFCPSDRSPICGKKESAKFSQEVQIFQILRSTIEPELARCLKYISSPKQPSNFDLGRIVARAVVTETCFREPSIAEIRRRAMPEGALFRGAKAMTDIRFEMDMSRQIATTPTDGIVSFLGRSERLGKTTLVCLLPRYSPVLVQQDDIDNGPQWRYASCVYGAYLEEQLNAR
jgi:hypothetical protein